MTILWTKLLTRKSLVPDWNTLAYRKGNYNWYYSKQMENHALKKPIRPFRKYANKK